MPVKPRDIALRAASAVVLAPAAVAATWVGGVWFLALMTVASVVLAFEWAAMSAPHARRVMGGAVTFGIVAAVFSAYFGAMSVAFVMLVFGAAAAGVYARSRGQEALDAAYGVLYLGWPSVLLIWLRDGVDPVGLHWTVLVFAVAWSADILAYLVGSTLGGPKLWPRFSPNKTWSGFIGGILAGAVAGAVMTVLVDMGRLTVFWGAVMGLAGALATMGGDLWESGLKRRFGVKDAGNTIPGHGGLLDRVDGLMFAVVVVAAGRLVVLILERAA
ncbi:MAG: phosphatidate cytidylyltransferase [Proteobacteria bacterium]|uniref:phosphatidate cytidylyltransferase n=1 Tax=Brevundimonas sp. TaxID=1871086 RepID=UPI000DB8C3BA|nr:CDP-archaeol synthase [Brevundimonas sp.]MBN9464207.1 CDP-archaeol synthase [Brevundimonas sp.]MCA0369048.1 phosphatidate cytidylyltransferase [Pseudomonadota bacterium]PZU74194.1 MAG: phosphatidate cytidylyltransferase [Brevundimonas sp.]